MYLPKVNIVSIFYSVVPISYCAKFSLLTVGITLCHTVLKKVQEPTLILLTAGWSINPVAQKHNMKSHITNMITVSAENIGTVTEQATDITISVSREW